MSYFLIRDTLLSIENTNLKIQEETERVPIYNYVSTCQNPITWGKFMKLNEKNKNFASVHCMWYYMLFLNKHLFVHQLAKIFLHMFPALIVDAILFLIGRKPM